MVFLCFAMLSSGSKLLGSSGATGRPGPMKRTPAPSLALPGVPSKLLHSTWQLTSLKLDLGLLICNTVEASLDLHHWILFSLDYPDWHIENVC